MQQFLSYYFWFKQPSIILTNVDYWFGYIFAGLIVPAIIIRVSARFIKNPVSRKLILKFWRLTFTTGLIGLMWFGVRFENTQVLGLRFWAGLIIIAGIIWLIFILKYLFFNFFNEKKEFEREKLKSKYLPGINRHF